jgi:MPBQ/MSBQ methyltransferase
MEAVDAEDWTPQTIDSWRHSNLVGVLDPWIVVFKWNPKLWYKVTREIVTLERMHQAFAKGLMQYGLMRGRKQPAQLELGASAAAAAPAAQEAAAAAATASTSSAV